MALSQYCNGITEEKYDKFPILKQEEICLYSSQYRARLSVHPNDLVVNLMA
jgi:hypothetical protein